MKYAARASDTFHTTRRRKKYDPAKLKDGFNTVDGEEIFYISNPALGLWTVG